MPPDCFQDRAATPRPPHTRCQQGAEELQAPANTNVPLQQPGELTELPLFYEDLRMATQGVRHLLLPQCLGWRLMTLSPFCPADRQQQQELRCKYEQWLLQSCAEALLVSSWKVSVLSPALHLWSRLAELTPS